TSRRARPARVRVRSRDSRGQCPPPEARERSEIGTEKRSARRPTWCLCAARECSQARGRRPALPTELRVPAVIIVLLAIVLCTTLAVLYGGHSAPSQLDIALGGLVTGLIPEPGPTVYLIDFVGEPVGALS